MDAIDRRSRGQRRGDMIDTEGTTDINGPFQTYVDAFADTWLLLHQVSLAEHEDQPTGEKDPDA